MSDYETTVVIKQRDSTTVLQPLQETGILTLTVEAGTPGPPGPAGPKGENGQAGIPDIIDGGNF